MERDNLLLSLFFVAMAILTWWLTSEKEERAGLTADRGHVPDYYMENFVSTEMGPLGFPARSLTAQRMLHYADDNSSELSRPRMMVLEQEKPPWVVRATMGWMSGDGTQVQLRGEVNIDRESGQGIRPTHLVTRDLNINTETQFAHTDQKVFITSLDDKVESVGMQSWLKAPVRIQLLSKVRGRYETAE